MIRSTRLVLSLGAFLLCQPASPALATILDALAALEYKDYETAVEELEPLAADGNAQAQFLLGKLLLEGRAGEIDVPRGVELVTKAAEQDFNEAMGFLGLMYARGLGVPVDDQQAHLWLSKAAEQLHKGPTKSAVDAALAEVTQRMGGAATQVAATPTEAAPTTESATSEAAAITDASEPAAAEAETASSEADAESSTTTEAAAAAVNAPIVEAAAETPSGEESSVEAQPTTTTSEDEEIDEPTADEAAGEGDAAPQEDDTADGSKSAAKAGSTEDAVPEVSMTPEDSAASQPSSIKSGPMAIGKTETTESADDKPIVVASSIAPLPGAKHSDAKRTHSSSDKSELLASKEEATNSVQAPSKPQLVEEAAAVADEPLPEESPAEEPAAVESPADETEAVQEVDESPIKVNQDVIAITPVLKPETEEPELPLAEIESEASEDQVQLADASPAKAEPADTESEASELGVKPDSADDGIRVQLAAVPSVDLAQDEWQRIRDNHEELLKDMKLIVRSIDLGEQGIFYRIQTGPFDEIEAARDLCSQLTEEGQDCLVVGRR